MRVLASRGAPLRKRQNRCSVVGREFIDDRVRVTRKSGQAIGRNIDRPMRWIGIKKDIVKHGVATAGILDIQRPASIACLVDGVVHNDVPTRTGCTINSVQRNSARVVVVQQLFSMREFCTPSMLMPLPPPTPLL